LLFGHSFVKLFTMPVKVRKAHGVIIDVTKSVLKVKRIHGGFKKVVVSNWHIYLDKERFENDDDFKKWLKPVKDASLKEADDRERKGIRDRAKHDILDTTQYSDDARKRILANFVKYTFEEHRPPLYNVI